MEPTSSGITDLKRIASASIEPSLMLVQSQLRVLAKAVMALNKEVNDLRQQSAALCQGTTMIAKEISDLKKTIPNKS